MFRSVVIDLAPILAIDSQQWNHLARYGRA